MKDDVEGYLAQVGIYEREWYDWDEFEREARKKELVDDLQKV